MAWSLMYREEWRRLGSLRVNVSGFWFLQKLKRDSALDCSLFELDMRLEIRVSNGTGSAMTSLQTIQMNCFPDNSNPLANSIIEKRSSPRKK